MCYQMSLQIFTTDSFIIALCTLVDFSTDGCYKIRMTSYYMIIYF
ncbi:unnamed protein product [Callosobruchus maculatus]|uniref:Uncharacterized protein n=1 Tax=Callosobruchus maculatus TaxID=64391 RepID=A0A653C154_CALMS|nr:unnamed protein product [Callosobruchus maculatus]